ncbi:MAG: hypothetical protein ACI841_000039, partial [Planctomycetota bacterium]
MCPRAQWHVLLTQPTGASGWDPPTVTVSPTSGQQRIELVQLGDMVSVQLKVVNT